MAKGILIAAMDFRPTSSTTGTTTSTYLRGNEYPVS
jgi:hypothetical protein